MSRRRFISYSIKHLVVFIIIKLLDCSVGCQLRYLINMFDRQWQYDRMGDGGLIRCLASGWQDDRSSKGWQDDRMKGGDGPPWPPQLLLMSSPGPLVLGSASSRPGPLLTRSRDQCHHSARWQHGTALLAPTPGIHVYLDVSRYK